MRLSEGMFVPILYRDPAFEAFGDFCNLVESVSCRFQKPVKFVVRIHAWIDRDRLRCRPGGPVANTGVTVEHSGEFEKPE
jgi:hypothetical protein